MNKLATRILSHIKSENYQPLKQHELAQALCIKPGKRNQFRTTLKQLENEGSIHRIRGNRFALLTEVRDEQVGDLRVSPKGFGFITTLEGNAEYYVSVNGIANAMNGDRVKFAAVSTRKTRRHRGNKPQDEVRITDVIQRKHADLVGLLMRLPGHAYVIPDDSRVRENISIREYAKGTQDIPAYHKVVVQLDPFDRDCTQLNGRLIEDLGHEEEPGVDIASIARAKGFKASHNPETSDAAMLMEPLQNMQPEERVDLRDKLIFTIDPIDAKDFDDAVSLEQSDDGSFVLGVHIADVAHYVKPGSPIDDEASLRGNSVYLVDRVIPMLPAHLTTNVCSLVPNEDRLTHSVEMTINEDLDVISYRTYPSIIHSKARLNYQQVQQVITDAPDTGLPDEVIKGIHDMHKLAKQLRAKRVKNGSVNLSLPEVKCILNEHGDTIRIEKRTEHESYQLIEEFMLLANCTIAGMIVDAKVPGLFRVHPSPDKDQWKRMSAELNVLGISAKPSNRADINRIANETRGTLIEYAAGLSMLRNFKPANYRNRCEHHFGLAFDQYTHFTSPIRRYPDLVIHRIVKAIEKKETSDYSTEQISGIAQQCSTTERAAMEAERESVELKRIEYYMEQYRKGKTGPYKAILSAVLPIGLIVEVLDTQQRGMVHFSAIDRDRYVVNETRTRATGRREGREFSVGMILDVQLIRVDERKKQIDFKLVKNQTSKSRTHRYGKGRRNKRR